MLHFRKSRRRIVLALALALIIFLSTSVVTADQHADETWNYIDRNDSNEDGNPDKGSHTNFANQQGAPDGSFDTLVEGDTGGGWSVPWLSNYNFRKKYTIYSNSTGNKTLLLDCYYIKGSDNGSDVYFNEKCLTTYGDLRFTNSDMTTLLDYYITGYDNITDYFGRDSSVRGIYEGNRPCAWFDSTSNTTYITWAQGNPANPFIAQYNHSIVGEINERWSDVYQVGSGGLTSDYHGAPCLVVDLSGYIHVMYGAHQSDILYKKSTNPYDITSWTSMTTPSESATYPKLSIDSSGNIHLYFRYRKSLNYEVVRYLNSTDNGASWSTAYDIVDLGSNKVCYMSGWGGWSTYDDTLHISWNYYDPSAAKSRHIYYAEMYHNGSLFSVNNDSLGQDGISLTEANAYCKAFDDQGDDGYGRAYHPTCHLDSNSTPYIMFKWDEESPAIIHRQFVWWNGTDWKNQSIQNNIGLNSQHDFCVYSDVNIEAAMANGTNEDWGGNMEYWSWDGDTWTHEYNILNKSDDVDGRKLNDVQFVMPEIAFYEVFKLVFGQNTREDGSIPYDTLDVKTYGWGEDGFVEYPRDPKALVKVKHSGCSVGLNEFYVYYGNTTNAAGVTTGQDFPFEEPIDYYWLDDFEDADVSDWVTLNWDVSGTHYKEGSYGAGGSSNPSKGEYEWEYELYAGNLSLWSKPLVYRTYIATRNSTGSTNYIIYVYHDASTDKWRGYDGNGDSSGSWVDIADSCPENNWYLLDFEFHCALDLWNITVYDSSEVWLGSQTNLGFYFNETGMEILKIQHGTTTSGEGYSDYVEFDGSRASYSVGTYFTGWDGELGYENITIQNPFEICPDVDGVDDKGYRFAPIYAMNETLDGRNMTLVETDPSVDAFDGVDNNTSNVDEVGDKGTESDFANVANESVLDSDYMTLEEEDTGAGSEWLSCDGFDNTINDWTTVGNLPWLNAQDQPTHYIYTLGGGDEIAWFSFPSTSLSGTLTVNVSLYCRNDDGAGDDGIDIYYRCSGVTETLLGRVAQHTGWQYDTLTIGSLTAAQVNTLEIKLIDYKDAAPDEVYADHLRVGVSAATTSYEVNFEYRWFSADYDEANENISIYVYSHSGNENLSIYEWHGVWAFVGNITSTGWYNFSLSWLTSEIFIIRLIGGNENGDSTQDTWELDVLMLHVWSDATAEINFEFQWNCTTYHYENEKVCFYINGHLGGTENLLVYYWTGSTWTSIGTITSGTGWHNFTATALTENNYTIRVLGASEVADSDQDIWRIDSLIIHVWNTTGGGTNYELDLEIQWDTADYDESIEIICIYAGSFNTTEDIEVWVWNETQTQWYQLWQDMTASGWNNKTVYNTVVDSNVTLRFLGGTESGDTERSGWQIDCTVLHTYSWQRDVDLDETVDIADSITKAMQGALTLFDAVDFSDDIDLMANFVVYLYETLAASDEVALAAQFLLLLFNTLALAGTVLTAGKFTVTFTDSVTIADSVTQTAQYSLSLFDEWRLGDTVATTAQLILELVDGLTLQDWITTAANITITLGDELTVADMITVTQGFALQLGDALTMLDDVELATQLGLLFGDSITLTDVVTTAAQVILGLTDGMTLGDLGSFAANYTILFPDALTLLDEFAFEAFQNITFTDGLGLLDELTLTAQQQLTLFDGITVDDVVTTAAQIILGLGDGITLADLGQLAATVQIDLTDGLTLLDDITVDKIVGGQLYDLDLFDDLDLADIITTAAQVDLPFFDALDGSDTILTTADVVLILTEGLDLTDTGIFAGFFNLTFTDALTLLDDITTVKIAVIELLLYDGLTILDDAITAIIEGATTPTTTDEGGGVAGPGAYIIPGIVFFVIILVAAILLLQQQLREDAAKRRTVQVHAVRRRAVPEHAKRKASRPRHTKRTRAKGVHAKRQASRAHHTKRQQEEDWKRARRKRVSTRR